MYFFSAASSPADSSPLIWHSATPHSLPCRCSTSKTTESTLSLTLSGFLYQYMMPLTCSSCMRFLNKALRILSSYDANSPPVSRSASSGISPHSSGS